LAEERARLSVGGQNGDIDLAIVARVDDFEREIREAEIVNSSNCFQVGASHGLGNLVEIRVLSGQKGGKRGMMW
jgi:gamma-glutamyl phosphate reductase